MPSIPTFAIVGAGFSGMAVAVQLLGRLQGPARVCLVNRSLSFGRGLAYGTNSPSHLLNVPAGRMGIDPEHESGFTDFLRGRGLQYKPGDFVPRSLFGDYLERCLLRAQSAAADGVKLDMVEAEVMSLAQSADGSAQILTLDSGREIEASEVVLALGNFTPRPPATASGADWNQSPLLNDVWAPGVLDSLASDASVLLIGTGLTGYDAVLRLLDRGHSGAITMLSRRALLPQPHREQETPPAAGLVEKDFMDGEPSLRAQVRAVRELVSNAREQGHDWRDVIGGLRPHTVRLWQQLSARARGQFLRHLMPHWDTHRHRAAPAIFRRIQGAMNARQLNIVAGRLVDVQVAADGAAEVTWIPRGAVQSKSATFAAVVNCTGPSSDLHRVADPLIAQLRAGGKLRVDALRLGLEVDDDYRLITADGIALNHVRYVGPLLKAQHWEATAVPELRIHARNVAEAMLRAAASPAS